MIAFFCFDGGQAAPSLSGWTQIVANNTSDVFTFSQVALWKIAGGSEPSSYAFDFGANGGSGMILSFTGANAAPIQATQTQINSTASTSIALPSVTASAVDSLLISFYAPKGGNMVPYTAPSGMTQRASFRNGTNNGNFGVSTQEISATGATGTRSATGNTSQESVGISILISSAAASSGLSGSATLGDVSASGAFGQASGVITSPVLKNNTGTILASVSGIVANVYHPTTGALIVRKTGLSSSAGGIVTITDVLIAAGTTYSYELDLGATSQGRRLPTGVAA